MGGGTGAGLTPYRPVRSPLACVGGEQDGRGHGRNRVAGRWGMGLGAGGLKMNTNAKGKAMGELYGVLVSLGVLWAGVSMALAIGAELMRRLARS